MSAPAITLDIRATAQRSPNAGICRLRCESLAVAGRDWPEAAETLAVVAVAMIRWRDMQGPPPASIGVVVHFDECLPDGRLMPYSFRFERPTP